MAKLTDPEIIAALKSRKHITNEYMGRNTTLSLREGSKTGLVFVNKNGNEADGFGLDDLEQDDWEVSDD